MTDTLSFANPASASAAAEDAFVLIVKSAIQQGIVGKPATAATDVQQGVEGQSNSVSSLMSFSRSSTSSLSVFRTPQTATDSTAGSRSGSISSSVLSMALKNVAAAFESTNNPSSALSATGSISTAISDDHHYRSGKYHHRNCSEIMGRWIRILSVWHTETPSALQRKIQLVGVSSAVHM